MTSKENGYYGQKVTLYDGACLLFTVKGQNKANWNARIKLPSRKGYIRRSLKTTNAAEAITLGSQLYLKLRAKHDQSLPVDVPTIPKVWREYLRFREAQGWSTYHPENWWRRYGKDWLSEFQRIDEVQQRHIDSYYSKDGFRLNHVKNNPKMLVSVEGTNGKRKRWNKTTATDSPSYEYLNGEISIIRSFFSFCEERGYTGTVPNINNPMEYKSRSGSNRGCPSIEQYRRLVTEMRVRCNRTRHEKSFVRGGVVVQPTLSKMNQVSNERLRTWILLLAATGIRVQEARQLRWSMIKKYERKGCSVPYFTLIDIPQKIAKAKYKGRRTGREVFSFDGNVTYDRLMNRWRPLCSTPHDDGLLFPSPRNPEVAFDFVTPFKRLLKTMRGGAMLYDEEGLPLSSYSLRHFYITMRIKNGVPLVAIAKNAGHTVTTLERTYNRILARDMVEHLANTAVNRLEREIRTEHTDEI